jgi:hypothetical protein
MGNIINNSFITWNIKHSKLIRLEAIDLFGDNYICRTFEENRSKLKKAHGSFGSYFTSLGHNFTKIEEIKEIPNALLLMDDLPPLGEYFILDKETGFFKRYFVCSYPTKDAKLIKNFTAERKSFEKDKNRGAAVIQPGKSQDIFNAVENIFRDCLYKDKEWVSGAMIRKLVSDVAIKER